MSTLILEVKFIDDTQSVDKEFTDLTALSVWLHGHRESDFDWLTLHDNNNDYVFEGWSDILQYIRENTGPRNSCIAIRASELKLPHIDSSITENVEPVPFSELPDGAWFCPVSLWAYGSKRAFQKTLEDGGEHNAVYTSFTETSFKFKDDDLVMRLNK